MDGIPSATIASLARIRGHSGRTDATAATAVSMSRSGLSCSAAKPLIATASRRDIPTAAAATTTRSALDAIGAALSTAIGRNCAEHTVAAG